MPRRASSEVHRALSVMRSLMLPDEASGSALLDAGGANASRVAAPGTARLPAGSVTHPSKDIEDVPMRVHSGDLPSRRWRGNNGKKELPDEASHPFDRLRRVDSRWRGHGASGRLRNATGQQ